ncbi:MAG TPA: hypothetical protein VMT69_08270 [Kineosporiaceae bacterium]|nr:hypothetical protein [Kineosporiaceae bacterium]
MWFTTLLRAGFALAAGTAAPFAARSALSPAARYRPQRALARSA